MIDLQKLNLMFDTLFSDEAIEEKFWDWYVSRNKSASTAKPNVSGELQLIEALEQYIDVLVQELNEVVVMAAVHGWRSSRFETGEQLRNKITELKSALTANNQK